MYVGSGFATNWSSYKKSCWLYIDQETEKTAKIQQKDCSDMSYKELLNFAHSKRINNLKQVCVCVSSCCGKLEQTGNFKE